MVVSCADPGIFARGRGVRKKTLITFFRHQLFYSFKEGYQWFIYKQNYIFLRFQKGSNILQGGGVQFFPGGGGGGGGGGNVNTELVNFQGGVRELWIRACVL